MLRKSIFQKEVIRLKKYSMPLCSMLFWNIVCFQNTNNIWKNIIRWKIIFYHLLCNPNGEHEPKRTKFVCFLDKNTKFTIWVLFYKKTDRTNPCSLLITTYSLMFQTFSVLLTEIYLDWHLTFIDYWKEHCAIEVGIIDVILKLIVCDLNYFWVGNRSL